MTPNLIAYVALLSWPLVALRVFRTRSLTQALVWTILGAQMLLPTGTVIKFEMIPPFDKYTISNIAALIGCLLVARRLLRIRHGFGIAEFLLLMYFVGPLLT